MYRWSRLNPLELWMITWKYWLHSLPCRPEFNTLLLSIGCLLLNSVIEAAVTLLIATLESDHYISTGVCNFTWSMRWRARDRSCVREYRAEKKVRCYHVKLEPTGIIIIDHLFLVLTLRNFAPIKTLFWCAIKRGIE